MRGVWTKWQAKCSRMCGRAHRLRVMLSCDAWLSTIGADKMVGSAI
jgi:hypothetical protein